MVILSDEQKLKNKTHLLFLEGLRGAAALYVVMSHAMLRYDLKPTSLSQKTLIAAFNHGHYAVNLFIVISGFSLMLPVIRNNYAIDSFYFFKRRIKRIIPPYFLALIFSALLIPLFVKAGERPGDYISFKSIITHILLVSDFFESDVYKINYSLWSIPVECRIYLFFPFLLLIWRKINPWATVVTALILTVLLYIILTTLNKSNPDINLITSGVNPYIILFTLGMLAAELSFGGSKFAGKLSHMPFGGLLILSLIIFIIYKGKLQYDTGFNKQIQEMIEDVLFGMVCFCLLSICAARRYQPTYLKYIRRAFSWRPFVFAGMFSYSIYLVHAPLLQIMFVHAMPALNLTPIYSTLTLIVGGTGIIIAVAYVFFLICEKPFLNKKRKASILQTELNAIDNVAI